MASRRDELNAYTFAKRRTVAAFLQPSASGSEEGAPRPLRAVLPGVITAALVLAAFGAWGMFKPTAPKGWDTPGDHVIVGKDSTTRYVVLTTKVDGKDQTRLHPVLNLASARLLLDPNKAKVVQVADKVLDAGKLPRGPIIGIPYAPDRLPAPADAGKAKRWAVCQQPGGNGKGVQTAAFVLADREAKLMDDGRRLSDSQALYVQSTGPGRARYLVDAAGSKYKFPDGTADARTMTNALVGGSAVPQPVTEEWLATLGSGDDLAFPELPGARAGTAAGVKGLASKDDKVGMVLKAVTGSGAQHYLVLPGKVVPVTDFVAWLMISSPATDRLDMHGKAHEVDLQSINPDRVPFKAGAKWPEKKTDRINEVRAGASASAAGADGARDTVCSVLRSVDARGGQTLSTWAGTGFPVDITASGTSAYVTPGTGLLYTQAQGRQTTAGGALFLVTDTGLRYAVQANGDSDAAQPSPGPSASTGENAGTGQSGPVTSDGRPAPSQAQARLGYEKVVPVTVPIAWSEFLSKGPRLDSNSARQPQGS
ncbi:type VII secretion protein EccB [Streptomyces sp. NBC_00335]|uniref:type VII secretion protein EccB n=1 Tax=unclassified Streptomyces TaxID=2593676 RepID=UPI00224CCAD4|nr:MULTISPECIES: type VII secretion protein EccB [unclassified Streptomyces]MCX5404260.1 type VII secretion protein EccB [Streptomyces sp. NBC_00086]